MLHGSYLDQTAMFMHSKNVFIVNDAPEGVKSIAELNNYLAAVYSGDTFSTVPKCSCVGDKAWVNKGWANLGKFCKDCQDIVRDPLEFQGVKIWCRRLEGAGRFINLTFYQQLGDIINRKNFNTLRWLTDQQYNPPSLKDNVALTMTYKSINGFTRNYTWFTKNVEKILVATIHSSFFSKKDKQDKVESLKLLLQFFKENKSKMFFDYLPLIGSDLFVQEIRKKGKAVDTNLVSGDILDIAIKYLEESKKTLTPEKADMITARVLEKITEVYREIDKKFLSGKTKMLRRQIYGFSATYTGRCVATPLSDNYRYDQVVLPWSIALTMFRPAIINKLVKKKTYSYRKIAQMMDLATTHFNKEIYDIMLELIDESFDPRGIPSLINRNPTLLPGSILMLYIAGVNKNPNVKVIAISALIAAWPNLDFDGDNLNIKLITDRLLYSLFKRFEVENNMYNIKDLYKLSGGETPTKTTISLLATRLLRSRERNKELLL